MRESFHSWMPKRPHMSAIHIPTPTLGISVSQIVISSRPAGPSFSMRLFLSRLLDALRARIQRSLALAHVLGQFIAGLLVCEFVSLCKFISISEWCRGRGLRRMVMKASQGCLRTGSLFRVEGEVILVEV
jgi:hypothetical protein